DNLQHVGGCGLLLQRFAQLVEQPRVLDRNHRLVGEGGGEFDLPVGEGAHLESRQYDHADRHALPQQRDAEHRVSPPILLCSARFESAKSGSVCTSATWTILPCCAVRQSTHPLLRFIGRSRMYWSYSAEYP